MKFVKFVKSFTFTKQFREMKCRFTVDKLQFSVSILASVVFVTEVQVLVNSPQSNVLKLS